MTVDKNIDEIGIDPGASTARRLDAPLSTDLVDRRAVARQSLRLVEPLTEEERLAILTDPLGPEIGERGSVSQRLFEHIAMMEEAEAREYLERVYRNVAAPLHLRAVLPAISAELERRKLAGVSWGDLTEALAVEVPLDGYAVTVVDANGYTACLLEGDYHEKLATAGAITDAFNRVAERMGASLIEPVVGDAGIFLTFTAQQQAELERELAQLHIPMKVRSLRERKYPNGSDKYPVDSATGERSFTLSTGIHPMTQGLKVLAYGGKGNRRGGVIVQGRARDEAVELQKHANPGETLRHGSFGESAPLPAWRGEPSLPSSNLIAIKLIEALLQMSSYSEAALAALLDGTETESITPRLEAYYVVLSLEDGNVEAFWDRFIHEGTGTDHLVLFKPVGARELHFWSRDVQDPRQFQRAFEAFVRQIKAMAKAAGCSIKLGLGHEQALDLLRLPGSFQVDATGAVIVGTVRAVTALHGREGDSLNVDKSACAALGLRRVEMTTRYIKGESYQGVHLSIEEEGGLSIPEPLVGREKELAALHDFVDRLGENGVAIQVRKSESASEGGYGESALLRATERYAREERAFGDNQVVGLGSGADLFTDLEGKLGHSAPELMEHPDLLTQPTLLFWDADAVSSEDAARVDRFLFAMSGAPLGLVYCGAYQFRPEAMMGAQYQGRALSATLELEPLSEDEALELVLQTRTDLDESNGARIRQLLREWKGPFTPRLLIHNFSAALIVRGANCFLDTTLLGQVWTGELAHILDAANLDEDDRTVLGIVAEIGLPISLTELTDFSPKLPWFKSLQKLVGHGLLKVVGEEGVQRFVPAEARIRKSRLLARQYAPAIRKHLMRENFFRREEDLERTDDERSPIELEHALGHAETCGDTRTFDLVFHLGRIYLNTKKDFGAAYELYHHFLQTCAMHGVDLKTLPQELVHDLVWVLTQTKDKKDIAYVGALLAVQERLSPELFWRAHGHLPMLPSDTSYAELMGRLKSVSDDLEARGVVRHRELESVLRLETSFVVSGSLAKEEHGSVALLPVAFSAAALSRIAYASRLFSRLAREVAEKMPDETGLVESLRSVATECGLDAHTRLGGLKAELVFMEVSTDLDQELRAEILRSLLDTHKYLSPTPGDEEMKQIHGYHEKAARSFEKLERPVRSASLDAFDVYCNAAALHWQRKLPLPDVFEGEVEDTASKEDDGVIWATLEDYESKVRVQLGHSIRDALLPLRYRLTLQLMNFIQLKMRLLKRIFAPEHKLLFEKLHAEYAALVRDSARLYQFLAQETQPDYYGQECLPIKRAVDEMMTEV